MKIDTGLYVDASEPMERTGPIAVAGASVEEVDDDTPSELVVLPAKTKKLIVVEPGMMAVLTAYGLEHGWVQLYKVLRSNGIPSTGTADCCPSVSSARSIVLRSVKIPCWRMDVYNPIFIVKVPGSYELEYESPPPVITPDWPDGAPGTGGVDQDVVATLAFVPLQITDSLERCSVENARPSPSMPGFGG